MSVSLVELSEKHQPSSSLANLLFNNTMLKCSGAQQRNTASRTSLEALWPWHPPAWHHTFWWTLKWYYSRARSRARHHTNPDWGRGHHRLAHRLPQSGAQWENNPVWGRKAEQQVQRQPGSTQWVGVERPSTADSYFTLQSIRKITTNVQDNTWISAHMCRQAPCAEHTILLLTKGKCKLRV